MLEAGIKKEANCRMYGVNAGLGGAGPKGDLRPGYLYPLLQDASIAFFGELSKDIQT